MKLARDFETRFSKRGWHSMSAKDHESKFLTALNQLEEFLGLDMNAKVVQTAVIQAFEYTYELAWRTLRDRAVPEGLDAWTPKKAFKAGIGLRLVPADEEALWLDMLEDRNVTIHTYDEELAARILEALQSRYLPALQRFARRL
ncbi:DUF86 domain-containing protein [bacterium]|nr:MAG: DUF86 domain-containing protein [bacterium]